MAEFTFFLYLFSASSIAPKTDFTEWPLLLVAGCVRKEEHQVGAADGALPAQTGVVPAPVARPGRPGRRRTVAPARPHPLRPRPPRPQAGPARRRTRNQVRGFCRAVAESFPTLTIAIIFFYEFLFGYFASYSLTFYLAQTVSLLQPVSYWISTFKYSTVLAHFILRYFTNHTMLVADIDSKLNSKSKWGSFFVWLFLWLAGLWISLGTWN